MPSEALKRLSDNLALEMAVSYPVSTGEPGSPARTAGALTAEPSLQPLLCGFVVVVLFLREKQNTRTQSSAMLLTGSGY